MDSVSWLMNSPLVSLIWDKKLLSFPHTTREIEKDRPGTLHKIQLELDMLTTSMSALVEDSLLEYMRVWSVESE